MERAQAEEAGALARLLARAGVRRGGEVPDAFACRLTMEVFREPLVTPAGLSYEASALAEHLAKARMFPHFPNPNKPQRNSSDEKSQNQSPNNMRKACK